MKMWSVCWAKRVGYYVSIVAMFVFVIFLSYVYSHIDINLVLHEPVFIDWQNE